MRTHLKIVSGLLLCGMLSSFSGSKQFDKPAELGQEVFNMIKSGNLQGLQDLMVTGEEANTSPNPSGKEDSLSMVFRYTLIANIEGDQERMKKKLAKGYDMIRASMTEKGCSTSAQVVKVNDVSDPTRKYAMDVKDMEIEYSCGTTTQVISLEMMNTAKGWRIMEKMRLTTKAK